MLLDTPTPTTVNRIQTTHYNLIDTIVSFMSEEKWRMACDIYYNYIHYGEIDGVQNKSAVYRELELAQLYHDTFDIPHTVAATLTECVAFAYAMDYGFRTTKQADEIIDQMILDERAEQFEVRP